MDCRARLESVVILVRSIEVELVVITHRHILCLKQPIHVKITDKKREKCDKGLKRKGIPSPNACELASFGRPRRG